MVTISFQSPDWNIKRNSFTDFRAEGPTFTVRGFDLDHGSLTVYPPREEPDINLTLAQSAPYMNEDGEECGDIGWVIQPEPELVEKMPELLAHLDKRYGRILVFADDNEYEKGWNDAKTEAVKIAQEND